MYLLTANVNIDNAPAYGIVILIAVGASSINHFQLYNDLPSSMENKPFFPSAGTLQGIYPNGWHMYTSVLKIY